MTTLTMPPNEVNPAPAAPHDQAQETGLATPYVSVALPLGLDRTFTYSVPARMRALVRPGQRVVVPFGKGNRMVTGWVVSGHEKSTVAEVKPVAEILDPAPLLTDDLLDLAFWISRYYVCPLGQVFEAILPAAVKRGAGFKTAQVVVRTGKAESAAGRILSKQRRVLDLLAATGPAVGPRELARQAGCTVAVIKSLAQKGLVRIDTLHVDGCARDLFIELEEP